MTTASIRWRWSGGTQGAPEMAPIMAPTPAEAAPHVPVLLAPLLAAAAPVSGTWIDGTFGAGGYARGLAAAGAARVVGIDRDPLAHRLAAAWLPDWGGRIELHHATFSTLDTVAGGPVAGVVLDLGVSSMQIDEAERGFSFQKDGPLDMRMGEGGPSAADLVATATEAELADILFHFGEERAARRIARAIVAARTAAPLTRTLDLAEIVARCLPRPKPGQSHPATRSFQALRIAVNAEFDELVAGLNAAGRALAPGGLLAVVSFHSLEDRVVKRFLQIAAGQEGAANRHAPAATGPAPSLTLPQKKPVAPDEAELAANPRARSALLRLARRTAAPFVGIDAQTLGAPSLPLRRRR
jgi:16S rRNA (cytosine1402-N4)-methyltransferase